MKYLVLDALSLGAATAGFTLGGPGWALGGYFAIAAARGIASATVTRLRERGDERWEQGQEQKRRRGDHRSRVQDTRIDGIEDRLSLLEQASSLGERGRSGTAGRRGGDGRDEASPGSGRRTWQRRVGRADDRRR